MQKEYLLDTLPTDFCFTADYPVHIICRVREYLQGQTKSTGPEWLRHHLGVPSGVFLFLFFYVIKLEWRAVLKLNKDLWPLVHKCSHTHGTIKALSSEGSWKRIWLEFKTAGNQEKKSPIRVRDHPSDEGGDLWASREGWAPWRDTSPGIGEPAIHMLPLKTQRQKQSFPLWCNARGCDGQSRPPTVCVKVWMWPLKRNTHVVSCYWPLF